jgi:sulfite exporter TauE/SafE
LKGKIGLKFSIFQKLSNIAESVVGISLIAIGLVGIKENYDVQETVESIDDNNTNEEQQQTSNKNTKSSIAIFANGVIHGFSWDGAPSLAPAIVMTSWKSALTYLLSYSFGTMAAMSITSGIIAESSLRLSQSTKDPSKFTRKLSIFSSLLAIIIGFFWIFQSVFR